MKNKSALLEALTQPSSQPQGEPVAYASRTTLAAIAEGGTAVHWLSHEPKGADCVPLYTHADPAEVERLRAQVNDWTGKWEKAIKAGAALERKLAERDALIRRALFREADDGYVDAMTAREELRAALSASAEPNQCDGCRAGIPLINGAHRMGKPGGYADTMSCQAGKYASAEPIQPACCAPTEEELALLANGDYRPEELWGGNKPSCHKCHKAEPSAPVELPEDMYVDEPRNHPNSWNDYAMGWNACLKQARAALEHKP